VIAAATKSSPECNASVKIPMEPVRIPTMILDNVKKISGKNRILATVFFLFDMMSFCHYFLY